MTRSIILIVLIIAPLFLLSCSDNSDTDDQKTTTSSITYSSNNTLTLKDVDFIRIKTWFENDILMACVEFYNMDTDDLVIWTDDRIPCSYTIYRTESLTSSEKYEEILSGEKTLSRSFQNIYIDVVDRLEKNTWYLIEFSVDTGYSTLNADNNFPFIG